MLARLNVFCKSRGYLYFLFCSWFYTFCMVVSYLWVHYTCTYTLTTICPVRWFLLVCALLFNFVLCILKCSYTSNIVVWYFISLTDFDWWIFGCFIHFYVHITPWTEPSEFWYTHNYSGYSLRTASLTSSLTQSIFFLTILTDLKCTIHQL